MHVTTLPLLIELSAGGYRGIGVPARTMPPLRKLGAPTMHHTTNNNPRAHHATNIPNLNQPQPHSMSSTSGAVADAILGELQ
jgi:hypothetical protein